MTTHHTARPTFKVEKEAKERLDGILTEAVKKGLVPSASFAFCDSAKILYSGCAGTQRLDDPKSQPVDRESMFWVCSQTKLVVCIALLQLIQSSKITYTTLVESIIPELENTIVVLDSGSSTSMSSSTAPTRSPSAESPSTEPPTPNPLSGPGTPESPRSTSPPHSGDWHHSTKPMQILHLLNHTSGLAYRLTRRGEEGGLTEAYTAACYEGRHCVERFFELVKGDLPNIPLAFEPGDNWAYGWSCDIASLVVERIVGMSIEVYCQQHIFGPLGIDATFYLTSTVKSRLVGLAVRQVDGSLERWSGSPGILEQDPLLLNFCLGGVGLYSTVEGYLTLLRHILQIKAGTAHNPILSQDTVNKMFEPTLEEHATKPIEEFTGWSDLQYGLGLCLNTKDWEGRRRKGSGFWYGWAGTYYFIDPTTGVAASFGAQVIPTKDRKVYELWERLEREMYTSLGHY